MDTVTCENCNFIIDTKIYPNPNYCPKCGNEVEYYETNYCPNCNPEGPKSVDEELEDDDKYCPTCGGKTVLYDYIVSHEK